MIILSLFLTMLFWHALADGPLQGPVVALLKRNDSRATQALGLFGHAYIHAFGVAVITGSLVAGGIELVSHAAIDTLKVRGRIGVLLDQALHVATKVLIIAVLRVRFV